MKDGPTRRFIKRLARWRYQLDLGFTRQIQRWRGEGPLYELRGHCTGCGACCETPSIQVSRLAYHLKTVRWLFLAWHRHINGFELVAKDRLQHTFIFRCTHYDPATGQCDSYDSRPGICRDYPRNLIDDPNPVFLDRCGYYPYARNADLIRDSFADLGLSPEQQAKLEAQFRITDPPQRHQSPDSPDAA